MNPYDPSPKEQDFEKSEYEGEKLEEEENTQNHQVPQENPPEPSKEDSPSSNWKTAAFIGGAIVVGAGLGVVAAPAFFWTIGLSSTGPVAGGLFASNMGAGLVSGSGMAMLQSAAMTSTGTTVGATVGAGFTGIGATVRSYYWGGKPNTKDNQTEKQE